MDEGFGRRLDRRCGRRALLEAARQHRPWLLGPGLGSGRKSEKTPAGVGECSSSAAAALCFLPAGRRLSRSPKRAAIDRRGCSPSYHAQ